MTALSGHINHVYEDKDLRFRDIKTIIKGLGFGDFDVFEKLDGQSLFVSWDFNEDKLKVARNKQNIKEGGLGRYGLKLKFGDRPKVESLFLGAYDALAAGIGALGNNLKTQIFGSMGSVWFPVELINPELSNTIRYSGKHIVFHEYHPTLFGFDGEPISHGLPRNLEMLKKSIPMMNENSYDWELHGPKKFPLKPIDQFIVDKACNEIDQIRKRGGFQDGTTIRSYLSDRLNSDMERYPMIPEHIRAGVAKSLSKMTGHVSIKEILQSLDDQTKKHVRVMINEEKNVILPKLLNPIESVVHKFSSELISFMRSEFIEDIDTESERLKKEYLRCSDIIRNGGNAKHQDLLTSMNSKIGAGHITMEGFIFKFSDKIFKVTGAFAPMNRVIATVKYKNEKKVTNTSNYPLGLYVST